jgi:hypothetical protein
MVVLLLAHEKGLPIAISFFSSQAAGTGLKNLVTQAKACLATEKQYT